MLHSDTVMYRIRPALKIALPNAKGGKSGELHIRRPIFVMQGSTPLVVSWLICFIDVKELLPRIRRRVDGADPVTGCEEKDLVQRCDYYDRPNKTAQLMLYAKAGYTHVTFSSTG